MGASRALRLAWWNTRLSLLKGNSRSRKPVEDSQRWIAAASVVRSLGAEGKDVLVLGEITQEGAAELAKDTAYTFLNSPKVDRRSGIAILYKQGVSVEFKNRIETNVSDRSTKQSSAYEIYVGGSPPLCLIPSHWPARGQDEDKRDRKHLGTDLQLYLRTVTRESRPDNAYVVFCGDFNDEPFDESMTDGLRGTRDRSIARTNREALYNPFWRMLGEREGHTGTPTDSDAGTYYYQARGKNSRTNWYTFDQFLVSQSFLAEGSDWQLCEKETQIWNPPLLRANRGIAHGFDHYPVAITLEARSNIMR